MERRVGAEALKRANKLVHEQIVPSREWAVCDEYEIRDGNIVAKHPAWDPESQPEWRIYRPLVDTPDLFLKLAAIHEAPNFAEAALAFSHKYGVLGGSTQPGETGDEANLSGTSLSTWRKEAERAWVILKLYEASLNFDGEAVRRLHAEHGKVVLKDSCFALLRYGPSDNGLGTAQVGFADSALMVQGTVQLLCREAYRIGPDLSDIMTLEDLYKDLFKARIMWEFDNLLGAMYLQMFWLIGSDNGLGRCEYCGRTFFFARTQPEGRKPRRDKRFCDNACRQAHHRSKKKG